MKIKTAMPLELPMTHPELPKRLHPRVSGLQGHSFHNWCKSRIVWHRLGFLQAKERKLQGRVVQTKMGSSGLLTQIPGVCHPEIALRRAQRDASRWHSAHWRGIIIKFLKVRLPHREGPVRIHPGIVHSTNPVLLPGDNQKFYKYLQFF